ncbi:hypothetical protein IWQ47_003501 [Aquimarina sp. EL_43]|uniref:hypothetical protein n=1 Tax=unclassified Aquimarina TaxID=2627091 RepID=UPI001A2083EE|nr:MULTISPECIES: hypothetical protein [unclassified Aquimarina]MBG6131757.1 hypothetical protein [Aquimarina sp. EL_35]MBG6149321.1 hypothetical protein [Aquimarina sp. EL_32]MBG6170416.1 hypothetical protein [Aquimarina sp. EL_43]
MIKSKHFKEIEVVELPNHMLFLDYKVTQLNKINFIKDNIKFTLTLLAFVLVSYQNDPKVYICMGKNSKRYHYTKHCRGLSRCSTKIYEVTLSKAKEIGRTLCGWED